MEDTKEKIENLYNLIQDNQNIESINPESFIDFYWSEFNTAVYAFLYEDKEEYKDICKKFKEICKWIIKNKDYFSKIEDYEFIPDSVIDSIGRIEQRHIFKVMYDGKFECFLAELTQANYRKEIESIINQRDEKEQSTSEKNYVSSHKTYMKNMISHSLNMFEKNFFGIPQDIFNHFIKTVENSDILEDTLNINGKQLKFEDSNLIYQYVRVVLKMKAIFKPEELINDKIIQGIYNGKIKDPKIIKLVFSNEKTEIKKGNEIIEIGNPFDYSKVLTDLMERDGKDTEHLYKELATHLQKVGFDDATINKILRETIKSDGTYNSLIYLNDLGIKVNEGFVDFVQSDKADEYPYVTSNSYLIELLKDNEKKYCQVEK